MVIKENKNSFQSSMFYKTNMKINKNLPKVYGITILLSIVVVLVGVN